jgi:hypothetical protein
VLSPARSLLERAFDLAYFFHPDREGALAIATRALAQLRLAERAQSRRGAYRPKGRPLFGGVLSSPLRAKVSVDRSQLLQRLVLLECDAADRRSESDDPGAATDESLVLRYVRHLVSAAARRNSLYVTTAITRILHAYTTAEVTQVYATVVQDSSRVPDDSYVRAVKQTLIGELRRRFGDQLRTQLGPRGETSFVSRETSPQLVELVRACLDRLAPWNTSCSVPSPFDAARQPLPRLRFRGADPDAEHQVEVARMHALIHPDCWSRLTRGLGLAEPAEQLIIPTFFRGGGEGGPRPDRTRPPRLRPSDLEPLRATWRRQDEDRGRHEFSHLLLRVDGEVRGRVALRAGEMAELHLAEEADRLEIAGALDDREAPLALVLLHAPWGATGASADRPPQREVRVDLGRGWELDLRITPASAIAPAAGELHVAAAVRRSAIAARAGAAWRRFTAPWSPLRAPAGVGAAVVLAVVCGGGLVLMSRGRQLDGGPQPATGTAPDAGQRGPTRGPGPEEAPVTLQSARRLYVGGVMGPGSAPVQDALARALAASGRFAVVGDVATADAAFKADVAACGARLPDEGAATCRLSIALVDPAGRDLWSARTAGPDWATAVGRAVDDLLERAQR